MTMQINIKDMYMSVARQHVQGFANGSWVLNLVNEFVVKMFQKCQGTI